MEKSFPEQKSALRQDFRKRRQAIEPGLRARWDNAIAARVLQLQPVVDARVVFSYLSRSGEVDTKALVQQFLQGRKRVITPSPDIRALPHDGLFRVTPRPDLNGHFPPALCRETSISQLDVVLVPGIIWDSAGYRVGFGGGYFDRLLSMTREDCVAIGLAYECQLAEEVPREPWDERVNLVVTESQVYQCR